MRLRTRAAALKMRFNRDFWMPERGYYALALDGAKRQVDAITSNPGHLLWTGIAEEEHARQVADTLLSPALFSGWGIRTMATTGGGYNPISYHCCGSVWPHDNSLILAGLLRYGYPEAARRVAEGLLLALERYSDNWLPELFAGFSTDEAPIPVAYFEANRPQAWATASVFMLLAAMMGSFALPDGMRTVELAPFLPEGVTYLAVDGIWRQGMRQHVSARRGRDGGVARIHDADAQSCEADTPGVA